MKVMALGLAALVLPWVWGELSYLFLIWIWPRPMPRPARKSSTGDRSPPDFQI